MSNSPYPGLRPFHRDEADIFFGRDEQVDQLLNRLSKSRFLAVVGPSGCGKSSLVHTGLLNALEAGLLADVGLHWRIATMQPGSHPMMNLASALIDQIDAGIHLPLTLQSNASSLTEANPLPPEHTATAFLLATLRRGPLGLIEALKEQPLPENTNLLLVVDQFEEIFRYRQHHDCNEADAFVALLLRSIRDSACPIYIILTMRSDFLGDCALFPGLPEALNDSQFLTPRLTREQRRLAITGPARVCGGDIEPALVNHLLNDMGADPDQLPILQHALMRLWMEASDSKPIILKLTDYEKLGGWNDTLSNHADEAYRALDETQQMIAERLFRALSERTGAKRDTRRPVELKIAADIAGVEFDQVIPVIEVFRRADRSFLMPPAGRTLSPETLIDISHESLIRQWQRMKVWVEQEAQSADTYRRLEQTALLHRQRRAGLLHGLDLYPVLAWKKRENPGPAWAARYGKDFELAIHFLDDSQRRETLKSIGKILGFASICLTAVWMTWLWHQTDIERSKAASARLLAEGQLLRSRDAPNHLSVLLGIEALNDYPSSNFVLNQFLLSSLAILPTPVHSLAHGKSVSKVVFSPDGTQIATASLDKTARLWNKATGEELHRLRHNATVVAIVFSPNGKLIATASRDNTARLWDATSGQQLLSLNHDDQVYDVLFSPDGTHLATASADKTARLWETTTGREVLRLAHDGSVNALIFSSDGRHIATASADKTARLWNAATGREIQHFSHDGPVNALALSQDGRQLASAGVDMTARVWDTLTGKNIQQLNHKGTVFALAFSPDGKSLATASQDWTTRLWKIETGEEMQRMSHYGAVFAVAFSRSGKFVASASSDKTARIWDAATGMEMQRLSHLSSVFAVAFDSDEKQLATASRDRTAGLWNLATGQALERLNHDAAVRAAVFSHDSSRLVTASNDKTARLWDTATGQEIYRMVHEGEVIAVAVSPDNEVIATASTDTTARMWHASNGQEFHLLRHGGTVNAVAFSPDGRQLATASSDRSARLWDTVTGQAIQRLTTDGEVTALAFNPDGSQLAAASQDATARVWDAFTGKELQRLTHDGAVNALSFSPDGTLIATASKDHTARIWNAKTGEELQRLHHNNDINAAVFSPSGKHIATVSLDKTVRLWNATTGHEMKRLRHGGNVKAVAFTPDGKHMATASWDNTARIWDISTGKEIQLLVHNSDVNSLTFSPDGKLLATASADQSARLWLWEPNEISKQLCSRLINNLSWDEWQRYFEGESYRKTCERLPAAPGYEEKGKQWVKEGRRADAIRMIQQLNAADSTLKLGQVNTLQKWMSPTVGDAEKLLQMKKIIEAIEAFNRIEKTGSEVISASSWNNLCWQGTLGGYPSNVLAACEKAVASALPDTRIRYQDSRGLARALSGNIQGAIEDFDAVITNSSDDNHIKQRRIWVQALRSGQNPFSKAELATLMAK